jgi:sulfur-oxidizing protein SoxB
LRKERGERGLKHLTLVQQNDIHGQTDLHWEHFWVNGRASYRKLGGFPRIATLLSEFRQQTRDALLFLDSGDEIHGTGPAQWTKGAAITPLLRSLGIDAMTPGNWEFGFGPEVLWKRVEECAFPVLACNVENAADRSSPLPASHVFDRAGVRVGVIGLTSPIVTEKMPRAFGLGLRFSDALDRLPEQVADLREKEKADLVVLLSHMGLAQDLQLASEVQGIDVVLSGHTHDRLHDPIVVGKTILIQSGFSGSFLGRLDLEIEGKAITGYRHKLIPVEETIDPNPAMSDLVDQQLRPHRERLAEIVGETVTPLHRMSLLETSMDNLITDAYLNLTGAEVAFSHGWRYGAPVQSGPVSMSDLWQIIPTNPEVFMAELSGEQIRHMLEQSFENVYAMPPLRQKGGYPIRVSGLSAVVRQNNPPGARVQELYIAGETYRPNKRYRIAGAGEQDLRNAESKELTGVHAIDAIRRYFTNGPLHCDVTGSKLIAV